jgi:diguanylate cyclase (GGDEF)-like protein
MRLKTKVSLLLYTSLVVLFIIISYNSISNWSKASEQSAQSQARATVRIIESGLNAHMVNGTMEQHEEFIKQISSLEGMKELWIARSAKVSRQYGEGSLTQKPRDGIDKSVLESGEPYIESKGGLFEDSTVRYSYPYKANSTHTIDCLGCHDVKVGDTLGVISVEMKTNDLKELSFYNIIVAVLLLIILFAAMVYFIHVKILVYFDRFEAIGECLRGALEGNFRGRVKDELANDIDTISLNRLMEKFEISLATIRLNLGSFFQKESEVDILETLKAGSESFSEIETFSHQLAKDVTASEMYYHIANHFGKSFDLDDINIIHSCGSTQKSSVEYEMKQVLCDAVSGCRAARNMEIVDSSQNGGICPKMITPNEHYICFPCAITPQSTLVVSMVSENNHKLQPARERASLVAGTLNAVRAQVAQRQMAESIHTLERVDVLTTLYNQAYLDERIAQASKEFKRSGVPYGVLVMNIDFMTTINHKYGDKIGDKVLMFVARALMDTLRESDLIVRTNGDEFVVLLYNCNPDNVASVGEKIQTIFASKKLKVIPDGLIATMSIGSCSFPRHHNELSVCVEYARLAMKESKQEGGNISTKYHSRMLEV